MKTIKIISIGVWCVLMAMGCEKNPNDKEQYIKQVYLVGANDLLLPMNVEFPETGDEAQVFFSVAAGGSRLIDRDVDVAFEKVPDQIEEYNRKFVTAGNPLYVDMPETAYSIPSMNATVKAGSSYQRVPFTIKIVGITPEDKFLIPLKMSTMDGFPISKKGDLLLIAPKIVNKYSGTYNYKSTRSPNGTDWAPGSVESFSVTRNAVAVGYNKIRIYHMNRTETTNNLAWHSVVVVINPDNSVTVEPWLNVEVGQPKASWAASPDDLHPDVPPYSGGTYDPKTGRIDFWYKWYKKTGGRSVTVMIKNTLTKPSV